MTWCGFWNLALIAASQQPIEAAHTDPPSGAIPGPVPGSGTGTGVTVDAHPALNRVLEVLDPEPLAMDLRGGGGGGGRGGGGRGGCCRRGGGVTVRRGRRSLRGGWRWGVGCPNA